MVVRDMRTRLPILWMASFFAPMSLSRVRSEIERVCAAWRLLRSICSGMFVSLPPFAVSTESQELLETDRTERVLFGLGFVQGRELT
jgi:hypothetical protein